MICSPVPEGNGAHVIHTLLESHVPGYQVAAYNPWWTLIPPVLPLLGCRRETDLIHLTPDHAIWSRRAGVPWVVTFHNYVLDPFMRRYSSCLQSLHYRTDLRLFTWLAVRWATEVTAVSRYTAELVRQDLGIKRSVRVIYNGVDETRFRPGRRRHGEPFRVLFVGNLTRRKGVQWLRPIAELVDDSIEILYTQGLRPGKRLPDHPQLRCVGGVPRDAMPDLYRQVDLLLFPSVREGFGLAAAEAMACGLPVVATNASSLPELVDEGKGGYLCPLGDVKAFAEAINRLADSPILRSEMGQYNRQKVEARFSLRRMIAEYRCLFEELLEGRRVHV